MYILLYVCTVDDIIARCSMNLTRIKAAYTTRRSMFKRSCVQFVLGSYDKDVNNYVSHSKAFNIDLFRFREIIYCKNYKNNSLF